MFGKKPFALGQEWVSRVTAEDGPDLIGSEEPPRCEGCEGTGLVYVEDGPEDSEPWTTLAICGDCNGRGAR